MSGSTDTMMPVHHPLGLKQAASERRGFNPYDYNGGYVSALFFSFLCSAIAQEKSERSPLAFCAARCSR